MRFNIHTGTSVAFVLLVIVAISHALVYWVPVWKTTSILRYHPKHGWRPIKHHHHHGHHGHHGHHHAGHHHGWKPRKKPHFDHHHHHNPLPKLKHVGWRPKKLCPLCHAFSLKPLKLKRQHSELHPKIVHHLPPIPKGFGFAEIGGFGAGKRGHGWGGWDW